MTPEAVLDSAKPYLDEVEDLLREAVATHPGLVSRVGAESVEAGGKRLRPLLIHLVGEDRDQALRCSVAIARLSRASL